MPDQPKPEASSTPSAGDLLKEIRQGSLAQQREIASQLGRSQTALGVDGALRLLQFLEEKVPCLDETQRLALFTGHQLSYVTAPAAMEIRDRLQAWWLKSEDRSGVDALLQLLITHAGLPRASVTLLKKVRTWVDEELIRQKLPRLQTLAWAKDIIIRRAAESGAELDMDAEVAALANDVLKKYRAAVAEADDLVYGELTVPEVRTWLACSRAVLKNKVSDNMRIAAQPVTTFRQETQIVRLFNSCRRWGVEGPIALEKTLNQRLRQWTGSPYELSQDSNGQWRWGDGTPAEKEAAVGYRTAMVDEGRGYGPRLRTVPVESHRFVRRGSGYAGLFRDKSMADVITELERAEAAARKSQDPKSTKKGNS